MTSDEAMGELLGLGVWDRFARTLVAFRVAAGIAAGTWSLDVWRMPGRRATTLCRALIDQTAPPPREPETPQDMMLRLTGVDITRCRHGGRGTLQRVHVLLPGVTAMRRRAWRPP